MTKEEQLKIEAIINQTYQDPKQTELKDELARYIATNEAKNANHMTFVNLSWELRNAIHKVKAKVIPGAWVTSNGKDALK